MLLYLNRRWGKIDAAARGRSIGSRLALCWLCMVLAVLSAALLLLSATGVLSHTASQFGETAALQQKNTAAIFTAQMDVLTAQGIELSNTVSGEVESFLAGRGLSFDALNDNPELIAELEDMLIPALKSAMEGSTCSGAYFCLDATANTSLSTSETSRAGVYLRYSGLRSAHPGGTVTCFRGTVDAARRNGLQLHNRWNPELNTSLIPGYRQVMAWDGDRLSGGCLWTERIPLLDTWESVTLLCVPVRDGAGNVRGVCGMELSDLYFSLSHSTVSGSYGSFIMLLAPMNGDTLLLDKAMLGSTEGTDLSASGEMRIQSGRDYDTFTWNDTTYLGKYQIVPGRLADGHPLAAVTLVPDSAFRQQERNVRTAWIVGAAVFLLVMLALAAVLSHRFVRPINKSLAAAKGGTANAVPSGIPEIDEMLALLRQRTTDVLPPNIEALLHSFAEKADTLTGTERSILQYYIDGYAIKDIPELSYISANTVKTHNRNIYRKLGINSFDELKVYIDLFERCGRSGELLHKGE